MIIVLVEEQGWAVSDGSSGTGGFLVVLGGRVTLSSLT